MCSAINYKDDYQKSSFKKLFLMVVVKLPVTGEKKIASNHD